MASYKIGKPIGLTDITWFPITAETEEGDTYGEPVKLARAIRAVLTPQTAGGVLESEDGVEEDISMITHYELTIDASQINDEVRSKVFGHSYDSVGGMSVNANDMPPYGALAFRTLLSSATAEGKPQYQYIVLYKGSFAEFEESFATKKRGGIEYATHTGIKGTFIPRTKDNEILYRVREDSGKDASAVISKWFTAPQEKTPAA